MFADVEFVAEERYRKVVPPWKGKAAHNNVHHRGRYICWMDSAAASTLLQFWPRTIRLLPVGSIKNRLRRHLTPVTMDCGIPWASDCTGGREPSGKEHMFLFTGGRRPLTMTETALKNNYALSNVVVSFCEMFTCPTFQCHEINNTCNAHITEHSGAFVQPLLQWKIDKYHILWECVCRVSYPTCTADVPYCHLWPAPLCDIFPHYLTKTRLKKLLNTKCVFRFSLQNLPETFFILSINERDMIKNVYWFSCKVPVILARF